MNTLRAKIIALIVAAILVVVGLATWLTVFLILDRPSFAKLADANAAQIALILGKGSYPKTQSSLNADKSLGIGFQTEPASGRALHILTRNLRLALQRRGLPANLVVRRQRESLWPVASIPMPDGRWLITPVAPPPPPRDISPALIGWILLIATGTTAVTIAAVYRLTQPLALIEKSLAHIGPHGELPSLPETGPAEVRATARAINLLSARLKSAMESRMRLVAAAGHDLRTPMTRMRLRAEFLGDPEREKWLADLDELDHIADSAIRLVREETEEGEGDPVRLDILLHEVVTELQNLQLDVRIAESEPAEVLTKPVSLRRALRNLLINAATYGKGASVSLRRHGAEVSIEITDRGPGIPEAMLERAFEPFFRVDRARSSGQGAGLGLTIAKEIIHRNKGKLALSNRMNGGLTQTIVFPIATNSRARSV